MLYEFTRMSWIAGIRSKKAIRVIGVFLLRDGKRSTVRESMVLQGTVAASPPSVKSVKTMGSPSLLNIPKTGPTPASCVEIELARRAF
jgi:hypothetical protein